MSGSHRNRIVFQFFLAAVVVAVAFAAVFSAVIYSHVRNNFAREEATNQIVDAGGWFDWHESGPDLRSWIDRKIDLDLADTVHLPVGLSSSEAERISRLFPEARVDWIYQPAEETSSDPTH